MKGLAIDFETYWNEDLSLKKTPTFNYVFNKKAVPYLMALHSDDFHWVGNPLDFKEWDRLSKSTLWAHNAHFDGLVYRRLIEDGVIPTNINPEWKDTADLVSYLRYLRPLDAASKIILGKSPDKGIRAKTKSMSVDDMHKSGLWDKVVEYGGTDAEACWGIQDKLEHKWPQHEQLVSKLSRESCWKGIQVDEGLAKDLKTKLDYFLWEVEKGIPWEWDHESKTPLAITAIRQECRKAGIPCPTSFDKDNLECAIWEQKYVDQYPWVRGIRQWRRVDFIRKKVTQLLSGMDDNNIYHYDMRYCGADTGRFAAGSGRGNSNRLSVHGLPRFPIYIDLGRGRFHDGAKGLPPNPQDGWETINVRNLLVARPGHSFVIWDLAQIEPRLVHWVTGNKALLKLIKNRGISVYQAEAETAYGWSGVNLKKEDPVQYQFIKTAYLGGQYQCGWKKLQLIAHKNDIELSDTEAYNTITQFRQHNPKVVQLWAKLLYDLKISAHHNEDFEMELPSGRMLDYPSVKYRQGDFGVELAAVYLKGDTPWKIYGGSLTNNLIQGTGRDVLCHKSLELHNAGIGWPLWTVHDEGVNEVPDDQVKDAVEEVTRIVESEIPWLKGLPLGVEVNVSKFYTK